MPFEIYTRAEFSALFSALIWIIVVVFYIIPTTGPFRNVKSITSC